MVAVRREIDRANRTTLKDYAESGVVKGVEVLTARDEKVCDYCRSLAGKTFTLGENPLKAGKCTGQMKGYEKPWCRCCYTAVTS